MDQVCYRVCCCHVDVETFIKRRSLITLIAIYEEQWLCEWHISKLSIIFIVCCRNESSNFTSCSVVPKSVFFFFFQNVLFGCFESKIRSMVNTSSRYFQVLFCKVKSINKIPQPGHVYTNNSELTNFQLFVPLNCSKS